METILEVSFSKPETRILCLSCESTLCISSLSLFLLPTFWISLKQKVYNDISPYTSKNGHHQKIYKQEILDRMWKKGNPLALLVEM